MKKMFFSGLICFLFLGFVSSALAITDYEIRELYRSHFRGDKLTQEQKIMLSSLSNEQKSKFYREALREVTSKRKKESPEALEKKLRKPGMRVEF